ncbi:DUF1214 domain-containing protein [Methylobacterium sp. E-066]|uniref:DUF1214 domain-containing protein n=1 Tax=Methylobacterium sp. E-066 TaxID=2836584 RepID=UPI001FB9ED8C|nr:DUF1214 domain-containing protein [Methylobacterium sp. E-066]MCJ2144120.1 DUF1214 domain-containing protein [Methylobacterium sp. E-066]
MRLAIPGNPGRRSAAGDDRPAPQPRSLGRAGRLVARVWRKSSIAGLAVYALALGGVLGLASADWATRGGYPFGGVQVGAWTAWPRAGAANADPYTRAVNARRGEIPLAVGEGLLLTAAVDDQGRALDATCTYRIGGGTPPARAWTLTVAGRGAREPGRPAVREGFTSTEILRAADGRFSVVLAPEVQPGNWLPSPRESGPVRLALRLYDTPAAASVGSLDRDSVPAITRLGCAS